MRGDGARGAGDSRDQPGMYPKVGRTSRAAPVLYRGSVAKKRAYKSKSAPGPTRSRAVVVEEVDGGLAGPRGKALPDVLPTVFDVLGGDENLAHRGVDLPRAGAAVEAREHAPTVGHTRSAVADGLAAPRASRSSRAVQSRATPEAVRKRSAMQPLPVACPTSVCPSKNFTPAASARDRARESSAPASTAWSRTLTTGYDPPPCQRQKPSRYRASTSASTSAAVNTPARERAWSSRCEAFHSRWAAAARARSKTAKRSPRRASIGA
jgi:hypothetical protein